MKDRALELTYEVELASGEKLSLPSSLVQSVGPGRWVITVQQLPVGSPVRDHAAFLRGYAPEDEGLYDDCTAG
jgi:hypothetical protein